VGRGPSSRGPSSRALRLLRPDRASARARLPRPTAAVTRARPEPRPGLARAVLRPEVAPAAMRRAEESADGCRRLRGGTGETSSVSPSSNGNRRRDAAVTTLSWLAGARAKHGVFVPAGARQYWPDASPLDNSDAVTKTGHPDQYAHAPGWGAEAPARSKSPGERRDGEQRLQLGSRDHAAASHRSDRPETRDPRHGHGAVPCACTDWPKNAQRPARTRRWLAVAIRAGNGIRTRDVQLGKLTLYH
jgi:hypothetical protein